MHGDGDALLSTTMTTAPSHYQHPDERLSYSNLEVVNHPVPAHQPMIGYDVEGQPYHYVPYSEAVKNMPTNDAMVVEHYPNPPPFVQNSAVEEKILSPGDSIAPEVAPHGYGHHGHQGHPGHPGHPAAPQNELESPLICGIRRRRFWIVLGVVVAVIVVAAVGGGVGAYYANRSKNDAASSPNTTNPNDSSPSSSPVPVTYRMNIAALRWDDPISHYRVYLQPTYKNETQILESAWDSDTQQWAVSSITNLGTAIKPNAPLTAVAGVPHSNPRDFKTIRNVYYPLQGNHMIERSSPYRGQEGQWGDENFSDLNYRFLNDSSMAVYLWQDMKAMYFILAMFYQERGANTLSIKSYAEAPVNVSGAHDWTGPPTRGLSIQDGSPLALAPRSDRPLVMLYMADSDGNMKQLPVDLRTNEFGQATSMNYKLGPHHPLCVSTEDNRNLFTDSTLPDCARTDALTHLILFADEDRQDLKLVSWNCSSGFVDATSRIKDLLKPKRTYLSVATTSASNLTFVDQRVYVLYDEGKGPIMEEWQIPDSGRSANSPDQGGNWNLKGEVPIAFG